MKRSNGEDQLGKQSKETKERLGKKLFKLKIQMAQPKKIKITMTRKRESQNEKN